MSVVKGFTAALSHASAEAILALANLKFDFSLVKIEAPVEFNEVGKSLSSTRRNVAEAGVSHVTARKLEALFEHFVPEIPTLIKAYGTRASKIATSPTLNPTGNAKHGFLAEHIGVDGTSLWAAATSGINAIAIHLLACMLANIFSDLEATAIWEEIVQCRLGELQSSSQKNYKERIHLSREQLRE